MRMSANSGTNGEVLAHEFGHTMGLEHSGDNGNLMYRFVPNGGKISQQQIQDITTSNSNQMFNFAPDPITNPEANAAA